MPQACIWSSFKSNALDVNLHSHFETDNYLYNSMQGFMPELAHTHHIRIYTYFQMQLTNHCTELTYM